MMSEPWFPHWNYCVMQLLFQLIPHRPKVDDGFAILVDDPLLNTWIFAFFFYLFWIGNHEKGAWRRGRLSLIVIAQALAMLISLLLRPWFAWPAPARTSGFQSLFPHYLWGNGTNNSFPSHSTLTYIIVAAGFWPLHRWVSLLLLILVLPLISIPRIYLGGHYPIDVVVSLFLAAIVLISVWHWRMPRGLTNFLIQPTGTRAIVRELLLFLWLFELAEGFKSSASIFNHAHQFLGAWWR